MRNRKSLAWPLAAGLVLLWSGCDGRQSVPGTATPPGGARALPARVSALEAGPRTPAPDVVNPYQGNVHALRDGERLYGWFNCAGCHGAIGGGAIGPPLRDEAWIYGDNTLQVYRSIADGRPQGMPAFGDRIPEDDLWKLVAFVRALGTPEDPTDAP